MTASGPVPIHRYSATAIYDPLRDRVIVFGGRIPPYGGPPYVLVATNEVWTLSLSGTPQWARLEIAGPAPSGRLQHTAIYDPARDRMIIHGGWNGAVLGDVWALDLAGATGWTELLPAAPLSPARYKHAAAYDAARDRMIVYGGNGPDFRDTNDTWELALSGTLAWRTIADPGPDGCVGHTLIYDPIGDRAVMLGGNAPNQRFSPIGTGIWVLPAGGASWTPVPYVRYFEADDAPAVYDTRRHRIVAYNGREATRITDIRLTDPIINYETLLATPWVRTGQTVMLDPLRDRVLLYGGRSPDSPMGDTWALDLESPVIWSMLSNDERVDLDGHSAIHDPLRDRLIAFGGWGNASVWQQHLSGTPTWALLATSGERSEATVYHSAIYDPRRDRMIIFGGQVRHGPTLGDTWSLSLDGVPTWTRLPSGPSLSGHVALYDPVVDRMLVLAGTRVWSLSLAEPIGWSELFIEGPGPPSRWDASALYDPIRNRILVYGGCCFYDEDYDPHPYADAWELSLDGVPRWRALATSAGPAGRNGASFVYDPLRDQAILWGGVAPDKVWFDDTWTLRWGNPTKPVASCEQIVPEAPLRLRYAVTNPLPAPRSVEWSLASERALPGLPLRGSLLVGGGTSEAVELELPIPDDALDAPTTLTFATWFSGAAPNADTCRSLIPERPVVIGFHFVPRSFNASSEGRWVTGYLEPTPPLAAEEFNIPTIRLNASVPVDAAAPTAIGDHDEDGISDLMVKFDRALVEATLAAGVRVPVTVTGTIGGQSFSGTDYVRVRTSKEPTRVPGQAPREELAVRSAQLAVGGRVPVEFALPDESAARLELIDVAGRALASREVGAMGPGQHSIDLAAGRSVPPGVYFVRLTQASTQVHARIAVLR